MPAPPPVALTRTASGVEVEVRRSARRRRTVSAYRSEGRVIVLLPARMSRAEEQLWVDRMVGRLERRTAREAAPRGDQALEARARALSDRWLEGRARPRSVRWSDRQQRRWGSCSVDAGAIRLSGRLATMPSWVVDYVLVHELTHLLVADHSAEFHAWVARYPDTVRAQAFLAGVEHAAGAAPAAGLEDDPDGVPRDAGEDDVGPPDALGRARTVTRAGAISPG